MKTAARVLIIISLFWNFILGFCGLIMLLTVIEPIFALVFIIFNAVGIVTGMCSLNRLNSARNKNELVGTAVCCLIFCNLVAGILMLCLKDDDLIGNKRVVSANEQYESEVKQNKINNTIIEKLKQLKELKDNEIITEEEFDKMKTKLLSDL